MGLETSDTTRSTPSPTSARTPATPSRCSKRSPTRTCKSTSATACSAFAEGKRSKASWHVRSSMLHAPGTVTGARLPEEFSGGEAPGQANFVLRRLGFTVVKKGEPVEADEAQAGKDWSEHGVRLVVADYFVRAAL